MIIYIKNSVGMTRQVKVGFSWTMLFFGGFVPLIRGDVKWFIISFLLALVSCGISWLILPFIYNKIYLREMFEKGWVPADEATKHGLKQIGYPVPEN